jgi:NADH:ubiquinone oxidoreductase subunit 5 (subunit L)/multisubunit Na+/H+ antiporter MnhA subunit
MFSAPKREEIDHLTIKFVVGLIAVTLAPLTDFFAKSPITSISASYYEGGPSQTIFIGFLFAIAAFLLAYNGFSRTDK